MPKNSCIMQIWAEPAKSALPICNYSQILYRFLTFTQNLKRSRIIGERWFFMTLVAYPHIMEFIFRVLREFNKVTPSVSRRPRLFSSFKSLLHLTRFLCPWMGVRTISTCPLKGASYSFTLSLSCMISYFSWSWIYFLSSPHLILLYRHNILLTRNIYFQTCTLNLHVYQIS